jgi:glycosyltransferase involved in cell wall biosynthesis
MTSETLIKLSLPGRSPRLLESASVGPDRLRIAMLAPPWIPVPPPTYGGIEAVVDLLCEALVARGQADRLDVPVVHTLYGALDAKTRGFYERHGHKARLVALSRSQAASAPAAVRIADVVSNLIAVDRWPLREHKQDYVLWVGRMDPVKGAHRAIEAARLARATLVLAGPIQTGQESYFRERIKPRVDGHRVHYIGEVGGAAKRELFANAAALLMPVRWREPFGMVMLEALACGTPVIAFPEGAAAEIVIDAENGRLVANEIEMAQAISQIASIDPFRCRASVAERYAVSVTVAGYERSYRDAIAVAGNDCPSRPAAELSGSDPVSVSPVGVS